MSDDKYAYGLNDLSMHNVSLKSTTGTDRLVFRVWGGSLRLSVMKEKEFKPIFEKTIALNKIPIIQKMISQVAKASPDSKFPCVFSTWDPQLKKWSTESVISFVKDDKNVYHVEVQWKGNKFDFILKGPYGVSFGSDPMSDAERSALELETLDNYIKQIVPTQIVLTNKRRVNPASGNNSSSSNSGGGDTESLNDFFNN